MADEGLREAAEKVFHRARSEDNPHRITLDTESLYELAVALYGKANPEVIDLRRNIDLVNEVAGGEEITMGQLVDRMSEFPVQEEKP